MAEKKSTAKAESKPAKKTNAKKPNKIVKYFKDLRSEFKKVVWPSRKTVTNNTGVVLVAMVISGIGIWGLDTAYAFLFKQLMTLVG